MAYNGNIEKTIEYRRRKLKFNFSGLFIWYLGIIVAFIPLWTDILVYLMNNTEINIIYFSKFCFKGDFLWIISTILILSLIEFILNDSRSKPIKCFALIDFILLVISIISWVLFKYNWLGNSSSKPIDIFFVYSFLVLFILTLIFCTPLQLEHKEVEK